MSMEGQFRLLCRILSWGQQPSGWKLPSIQVTPQPPGFGDLRRFGMNAPPRRALRRIVAMTAVIALGAAATYATVSQTYPPLTLSGGVVLMKAAAVTGSVLSNAARSGLHRAAVAAVVVSAKSASHTVTTFAKASAESARVRKGGGCPLRNTGSCPACTKRSGLGA